MPRQLYLFYALKIKLPGYTEAEVHKCSSHKVLLNISQISLEKMHVLEYLFKKASGRQVCKFIKKRPSHRYFPVEFARFSKALSFTEPLQWLVFKISNSINLLKDFSGICLMYKRSLITCNSHSDELNLKMHSLTKKLFRQSVFAADLAQTRKDLI